MKNTRPGNQPAERADKDCSACPGLGRCSSHRPLAFLAVAFALTGCATVHTKYIQTYCVSQDQYAKLKSAEPPKIGQSLTGNAQQDFKIAAGQDVALRAYADGLLGVIGGCTEPPH